jgi:hypothetical protein
MRSVPRNVFGRCHSTYIKGTGDSSTGSSWPEGHNRFSTECKQAYKWQTTNRFPAIVTIRVVFWTRVATRALKETRWGARGYCGWVTGRSHLLVIDSSVDPPWCDPRVVGDTTTTNNSSSILLVRTKLVVWRCYRYLAMVRESMVWSTITLQGLPGDWLDKHPVVSKRVVGDTTTTSDSSSILLVRTKLVVWRCHRYLANSTNKTLRYDGLTE